MDIDQIILSTNEDKTYLNFWPAVSYAYRKMFPDVTIKLAFLTNRGPMDPMVQEMSKHGEVVLFEPLSHIPEFSQAKMCRFVLASMQGTEVCYVDDIDLFPLRKDFITDKTEKRPDGALLCVGGEVYHNRGSYPVSQMTAEGYIWKKFINPKDMDWQNLMESWRGPVMFEPHEDPMCVMDFAADVYFSDERLLRRLIHNNPVSKHEMPRGYENYMEATIDRADWKINEEKLKAHGYVNAHCGRPYDPCDHELLFQYIRDNYPTPDQFDPCDHIGFVISGLDGADCCAKCGHGFEDLVPEHMRKKD